MTTAQMEKMLEYRQLASRMRREIASLTEQYPDRWVAMTAVGELLVCASMDEIIAALDERQIRDENVSYRVSRGESRDNDSLTGGLTPARSR